MGPLRHGDLALWVGGDRGSPYDALCEDGELKKGASSDSLDPMSGRPTVGSENRAVSVGSSGRRRWYLLVAGGDRQC
jgi:hypothetical protein